MKDGIANAMLLAQADVAVLRAQLEDANRALTDAKEIIIRLLTDAAHTDFGDCEPWDSIMDAERFLDRLQEIEK